MVDTPKQLASEAESLRRAGEPDPIEAAPVDAAVLPSEVIDARFAALSADALAAAVHSDDPCTRLAAGWRLLVRDQALGTAPPTDGLRLMLLVNVASVQDLDLLVVLAVLDPSPAVRGAALTFLWRVARDRDRVVALLASRMAVERARTPLLALFDVDPPLPFARIVDGVRVQLEHPMAEIRARALHACIANSDDEAVVAAAILREPDRALRTAALGQRARAEHPERMLRWIAAPALAVDALAALVGGKRRFSLAAVAHLLDAAHLESVLALVEGPYTAADRERLFEFTRALDEGAPTQTSPALMRCLADAHRGIARTDADELRIAQIRAVRERVGARLDAMVASVSLQEHQTRGTYDDGDDESWDEHDSGFTEYALVREALHLDVVLGALLQ